MQRLSSLLRGPFSFLFARSSTEDRVAAYVIREHARGRGLSEILGDRYVQNRLSPEQQRLAFYRLWTRKEAMSKVSGQGIVSPPVATPSLATLHSFQFRLGEADVIGALALDSEV